ncbi:MAG: conserved hypothetical exported protein [Devosia sp.]|uniref:DUF930 domain-containing protein n=1 Tax=Devosia sp. TaxID=1871048 RepID=UPI002619BFF3|nr:DUF930 domain-containing protein [Devosia sp.]MDB5529682.1 conserved hypothetical exported protein [Devosia sp.]
MASRIAEMRLPLPRFDGRLPAGAELVASALLHAMLLALLLHQARALPDAPPEHSIAIDLVTAEQYAAATALPAIVTAPASKASVARPPPEAAPVAPPSPAPSTGVPPSGMVHPTQLLGAGVLAEPASKEVRETLPLLGGDERKVQLCNIEALAQIHAADPKLDPDVLVAYAMADMDVSATSVTADGGAFRSQKQWYGFKFRCAVAADLKSVTDFSFAIGEPIPKSEWESHDLTAEDQEMD